MKHEFRLDETRLPVRWNTASGYMKHDFRYCANMPIKLTLIYSAIHQDASGQNSSPKSFLAASLLFMVYGGRWFGE